MIPFFDSEDVGDVLSIFKQISAAFDSIKCLFWMFVWVPSDVFYDFLDVWRPHLDVFVQFKGVDILGVKSLVPKSIIFHFLWKEWHRRANTEEGNKNAAEYTSLLSVALSILH